MSETSKFQKNEQTIAGLRKTLRAHSALQYEKEWMDLRQTVSLPPALVNETRAVTNDRNPMMNSFKDDLQHLTRIEIGNREKKCEFKELRKQKNLSKREYKAKIKDLRKETMIETLQTLDNYTEAANVGIRRLNEIKERIAEEETKSSRGVGASTKATCSKHTEKEQNLLIVHNPLNLTGAFVNYLTESLKMHDVPIEKMNLND